MKLHVSLALSAILAGTALLPAFSAERSSRLPRLKVSKNNRYLVTGKGQPFFYLADTAWELFHRLNREEADRYLKTRANQGYTAIQAVALAELDGVGVPNAHGDLPLVNRNPAQPNITSGSNPNDETQYDYWDHVDYIVDRAAANGMYIALLPTWGRWVHETNILTQESARTYGEFIGRRYGNKPVIWVIGGDRNPEKAEQQAIWRAMAEGITRAVGGRENALMTYHPTGSNTSSKWFHNDDWLDFNMQQNGHCAEVNVWDRIQADYNRTPTKPVMDGEPIYEDHPICFNRDKLGTSVDVEPRRMAYWDVLAGAHGHTYGNHSVWQMHSPTRGNGINGPTHFWYQAIERPGGKQMQHLRRLIESRPMLARVPDQSVLASEAGGGLERVQATRASDGSYFFVYTPMGRAVAVHMNKVSGRQARASWFDPRTGASSTIGTFPTTGTREFTPASSGAGNDWVLVIDDASKRFPAPGKSYHQRSE